MRIREYEKIQHDKHNQKYLYCLLFCKQMTDFVFEIDNG